MTLLKLRHVVFEMLRSNSPYLVGQNTQQFHNIELNAPEMHLHLVFWMFSIPCLAIKEHNQKNIALFFLDNMTWLKDKHTERENE